MANTNTELAVKFALRIYHYRTHKPQGLLRFGPYRTARAAAKQFADHVAMDFAYRYPKKYKRKRNKPGTIVIEMVDDSQFWKPRHEKAYRRSLKIFKAIGLQ